MPFGTRSHALPLGLLLFVLSFVAWTHAFRVSGPSYRDRFDLTLMSPETPAARDLIQTMGAAHHMATGKAFDVPYPPLGLASFLPFHHMPLGAAVRLFSALLLLGLFTSIFLALRESRVLDQPESLFAAALVTGVLYHSYWFQFELERGNSNVIASSASMIGLFFMSRGRPYAAAVAIAYATQWRAYPAALAPFLLVRGGLRPVALYLLISAGGFFIFGLQAIHGFQGALKGMTDIWSLYVPNHSLRGYFHARQIGHAHAVRAAVAAAMGGAFSVYLWLQTRAGGWPFRPVDRAFSMVEAGLIGMAFGVMGLVTTFSMPYKLGIHIIPFLLLITRRTIAWQINLTVFVPSVIAIALACGFMAAPGRPLQTPALIVGFVAYCAVTVGALVRAVRRRNGVNVEPEEHPLEASPKGETERLVDWGSVWAAIRSLPAQAVENIVLWTAVVVGLLLRLSRASATGLGSDDLDTWVSAMSSYRSEISAPLMIWILSTWLTLVGDPLNMLAIALPSILFGTLAIVAVYALASELYDRRTGVVAAVFMAIFPTAIAYSREIRSYALLQFLVPLMVLSFVRVRRGGGAWNWAGLFLACVAGLMTNLSAGFVVAGLFLWSIFDALADQNLRRLQRLSLLLIAAWFIGLSWTLGRGSLIGAVMNGVYPGSPLMFLREFFYALGPEITGTREATGFRDLATVLLLAAAVAGTWRLRVLGRGRLYLLFPLLFGGTLVILWFTLGFKGDYRWARYMMPLVPLAPVLVAGGLVLGAKRLRMPALAFLPLLLLWPGVQRWRQVELGDRSAEARLAARALLLHRTELNGVVQFSVPWMARPVNASLYRLYRQESLPTFLVEGERLLQISSDPLPTVPPDAVSPVTALPAGRYLVLGGGPSKDVAAKLRALVGGIAERDAALSERLGFDVIRIGASAPSQRS